MGGVGTGHDRTEKVPTRVRPDHRWVGLVGGGEGRYSCWRSRRGTPHPLHMLSTAELPRVHRVIVRAPRVRDAPSLSPGHTGVRRKVAASRQECEQNAELVDLRSTLFENTWPDPYTHKEPRSPSSWDAATPAPRLGATAHVRNNRRRRKTGWMGGVIKPRALRVVFASAKKLQEPEPRADWPFARPRDHGQPPAGLKIYRPYGGGPVLARQRRTRVVEQGEERQGVTNWP